MKHFLLLVTMVVFSCSFQACKKGTDPDDPGTPGEPPPTGTENAFSCKIDGDNWTPDMVRIRLINDILSIQGQTDDQDALTITVDDQSTGTFTFEIASPHSAAYLPEPGQAAFMTGISALASGSIEVTKLDVDNKKLSATFQFTGYRTDGTFMTFTEGKIVDHDIE